ncbi:hypothetical protein BH23GEM5_BH23GEM5_10870 [soil metagenome]
MMTSAKKFTSLVLVLSTAWSCQDALPTQEALRPEHGVSSVLPADEADSRIVVDAAQPLGAVMRMEKATTHSTSSPLPGEPTRSYMQGLDHEVVRTWIQTRYVYNKGDIDYNYKYELSGVGAEDALRFYATTGKSVLIALSAYKATSTWPLPQGEAFKDFLRETLIYYKSKYPNIRYIQVGNEPNASGETAETYYPIYRQYYRAVNEANAALGLGNGDRLLISNGAFTSNVTNMLAYADPFLAAYAADPDPTKKLDFFSFHVYGETDRPLELLTARKRVDAAMRKHGLPVIPAFVTEYGVFGGSTRPRGMTDADLVTIQPAGQLTKAFYLYEGGIDNVFNWAIHHATLPMKSQLADVQTAIRYPYGNMLLLAKEVSDRRTRIGATSKNIDGLGLGTHVLASMRPGKGVAVLVWNYHWRKAASEDEFEVLIKNIPHAAVGGKRMRSTIYIIDSKNNNYYTDPRQTTLEASREEDLPYSSSLKVPLKLERHAVALILLTHK